MAGMEELNTIQRLIIWAPPILLAITLHEVAHGWTARVFGDTTAQSQGRLSLNPLRHIDPVGTVLIPLLLFFLGGFIFGWAKPVPVNVHRLRHPKHDMALVALAGPGANLVMAIAWGLVMVIGQSLYPDLPALGVPLYLMGHAGIVINVVVGVLNMLPVPPLDGSRVLSGLLPEGFGRLMAGLEPYGLVILLLLLATGLLGYILQPIIVVVLTVIFSFFG
jgi:Zn-dependent protease